MGRLNLAIMTATLTLGSGNALAFNLPDATHQLTGFSPGGSRSASTLDWQTRRELRQSLVSKAKRDVRDQATDWGGFQIVSVSLDDRCVAGRFSEQSGFAVTAIGFVWSGESLIFDYIAPRAYKDAHARCENASEREKRIRGS